MRITSLFGLTAAFIASATLIQGCRTIGRSRDRVTADDIPFETAVQPSRIARSTVAETPVAEPVSAEALDLEAPDVGPVVAPVAEPVAEPVEEPVAEPVVAPVAEPVAVAPVAEPVAVAPVAVAPVAVVVPARRPEMDTTPYEAQLVKSPDQVGKPGSYVERVIPSDGGDKPVSVEANGLTGQTGRHVPAPEPVPEPVPVMKPAPADAGVYVVQPGDILGRIAVKHGVSRQAILDANPSVKDPNKLKIGQKLSIPPRGTGISDKPKTGKPAAAKPKKGLPAKEGFTVYTVQPGDILGRIAIKHKTTQKAILAANPDLVDPGRIRAGRQLYVPVPGATVAAPAPAPKKAAAEPAPAVPATPASEPAGSDAPPASTDDFLNSLGI